MKEKEKEGIIEWEFERKTFHKEELYNSWNTWKDIACAQLETKITKWLYI